MPDKPTKPTAPIVPPKKPVPPGKGLLRPVSLQPKRPEKPLVPSTVAKYVLKKLHTFLLTYSATPVYMKSTVPNLHVEDHRLSVKNMTMGTFNVPAEPHNPKYLI